MLLMLAYLIKKCENTNSGAYVRQTNYKYMRYNNN